VNAEALRRSVVLGTLLLAGTCSARAQAPAAYLSRGIEAYQALDYDAAAGWLRRALTPPLVEGLPAPDQVRGLAYLGATERFRGRSDSAESAFRRLLRLDPRARPDPLVFPPEVTRLFDQTRARFPIVGISGEVDATVNERNPAYRLRLHPSVPHDVTLTLDRPDAPARDTLYAGPVGDSLVVEWNGRDRDGVRVASGQYWFTATTVADGPGGCRVRLPVNVVSRGGDTASLPLPLLRPARPEVAGPGDGPSAFVKAGLFGGAALALPLLARDAGHTPSRLVGAAFGITGIVAYLHYRVGRPIPENIAANALERARWQHQVELVKAENAERLKRGSLWIHASAPLIVGCEGA
jgi:hypothetical protein